MLLKIKRLKNLRKLAERLKDRDCDVCGYPLYNNSIPITELTIKMSNLHVQCTNCLSIYDHSLELKHIGITRNVGLA